MKIRFLSSFYLVLIFLACYTSIVAQKPELVVQIGHSGIVKSIAFNPNGKFLASGSGDNTIKLWDATTGTELLTLYEEKELGIEAIAFNPVNGEMLASGSIQDKVSLWNISTGKKIRTLVSGLDSISSVAFSPDGKTLAVGGSIGRYEGAMELWDVSTGIKRSIPKQFSDWINCVAFSPDGKVLVAAGDSYGAGPITFWSIGAGRNLRLIARKKIDETIDSIAFSSDGKILASAQGSTIKLWNTLTGTELRTFNGEGAGIKSLTFGSENKVLVSGNGNNIRIWDVSTGAVLNQISAGKGGVQAIAISRDDKRLAFTTYEGFKLWEFLSTNQPVDLTGHSSVVRSVAFSPDGKFFVSGTGNTSKFMSVWKGLRVWDISAGTLSRNINNSSEFQEVTISHDSKVLASGNKNMIRLWDITTNKETSVIAGERWNEIETVIFSPNGKEIVSNAWSTDTINFWDILTGKKLRTVNGSKPITLSPDGQILASRTVINGAIQLINLSTDKVMKINVDNVNPWSLAFSPDRRKIAIGGDDSAIIYDVLSGRRLQTLKGHSNIVDVVAFSPDGKLIVTGSADQTIKLWNAATGTGLFTLRGHSSLIKSIVFSPDSKILVSGSDDATTKFWSTSTGQELATLITFDEHDWAIVTPDGLFDGTPMAWKKLIWRFNQNGYSFAPVEAFFNEFYYPGLLANIFAGKQLKAPQSIEQKDRRQPKLSLEVVGTQTTSQIIARTIKVAVKVEEAPAGAQDVRLFRNGSLVKAWHGDVLNGKSSVILEATLPIVAGENRLTAYAFNKDNIKSSDATLTITGAESLKRKGVAYVLAVGINEYANSQYNLKYAVPDAQDFSEEVTRQQSKLGQYERVEVISFNDKDATKTNILNGLTDLSSKIQPEDAVIIYFAGHGTAQGNRFYLILHDLGYSGSRTQLDAAGLQSILSHSISDEELEKAVEGVDAGQMLLVIDACNSGQALEAEEKRRGPMNSKGLAQLAYEKGMYILTAAQSYQAALEASKLGHGYLTYALVEEGLKTGAADREPKDNQVLLREWLDYATNRVPQMQEENLAGKRQLVQQETQSSQPAGLQRPRVFYRREVEPQPLVIARP